MVRSVQTRVGEMRREEVFELIREDLDRVDRAFGVDTVCTVRPSNWARWWRSSTPPRWFTTT
jgi:hypothetical protein